MSRALSITNATKAGIIGLVNAVIGLLIAFGVELSEAQQGALITTINAALVLWVGLTYDKSRKRTDA